MGFSVEALGRIWAMVRRYGMLHKRSLLRTFDVFFWPVMDLLVWGFVTVYLQKQGAGPFQYGVGFLIGGMIFWDLHYRAQQGITISLMEEIWTRNIVNLMVTPLRRWEWLVATMLYGFLKVMVIGAVLGGLSYLFYAFKIWSLGWALVPLLLNLLLFGWAVGLVTAGCVIRYGYAAEALIWGIPFLIQPFSAVFYPVEILPQAIQPIAYLLPSTHIFEAMRAILGGDAQAGWERMPQIVFLNGVFLVAGGVIFSWFFRQAQARGRLGRLGQD